jgi:hypothetical protein
MPSRGVSSMFLPLLVSVAVARGAVMGPVMRTECSPMRFRGVI